MIFATQAASYTLANYLVAYAIIALVAIPCFIWMHRAGVPIHKILLCALLFFMCPIISIILMVKYTQENKE